MNDKVNHPSHYTTGTIEMFDYIRDKLSPRDFTAYCIGNVMKYISRWREKDGVQDLMKANVYLGWAIESAEKEISSLPNRSWTGKKLDADGNEVPE